MQLTGRKKVQENTWLDEKSYLKWSISNYITKRYMHKSEHMQNMLIRLSGIFYTNG